MEAVASRLLTVPHRLPTCCCATSVPLCRAQFRQLVAQARLGGLLGDNAGLVYVHMGRGHGKLDVLWDVVNNSPLPITQMLPTHVSSRSDELVGTKLCVSCMVMRTRSDLPAWLCTAGHRRRLEVDPGRGQRGLHRH